MNMNKIHGINFLFMLSFSFGIPTTLLHTIIITNLEFIGIVNLLHYSLTTYVCNIEARQNIYSFPEELSAPWCEIVIFSVVSSIYALSSLYVMQTPFALFVKQAAA